MRFNKILKAFLSIALSGALMLSVFNSTAYNYDTTVDLNMNGAAAGIRELGKTIQDILSGEKETSEEEKIVREKVFIGGYPVGLKLYADGVVVVGTEPVDTENGPVDTAQITGIMVGDIIKTFNGEKVTDNRHLSRLIEENKGKSTTLTISRDGEIINIPFCGAYSISEEKYKAGVWVRDSCAGIGTVTFCTKDGYFACLGHAVCDIDTKLTLPISSGECTSVHLTGYKMSKNGFAGELCGYLEEGNTGTIMLNCNIGVYGRFSMPLVENKLVDIAENNEVEVGEAEVYTTLEDGAVVSYDARITQVNHYNTENKNLLVEITDEELISKTGGIVQGMSGSPVIQNGMLVGAITHVIVDNPTKGYGIFAETMMDSLENAKKSYQVNVE